MKLIIIITFIFGFFSTFVTEVYLKKKGLGDPVRYDSSILYGYSPKPNQKKKRIAGSYVTINEHGLRSINSWNSEKKKILFLGDSVTYGGSYIDDNDIFSTKVCSKLKNFTCGNAGVNAYSVLNIVLRSKFDSRIQDADVYIYLFPPGDFYRDYANSQTAHFYLNNKKFFLPAITEAISFVFTKYDINKRISKYDDTSKNFDNYFKIVDFSIKNLKEEIANKVLNNKEIFIFLSNEKSDKNYKKDINKYVKDSLLREMDNIILLNETLNDDEFFYDESVHLNIRGHEVVANKIFKIIENKINN